MIYPGKSAVVLGLGGSGEAAAMLLVEEGARVTVCESARTPALESRAEALRALGARVLFGHEAETDASRYDVCVISPGIDPSVPLVFNVASKRIPMIGEIELAYRRCLCPVVAITGTNGKTTTTGLATAMLQAAGLKAVASGNIGLPFSQAVRESGSLDVMVLEVSSFQLETIRDFRPKVAAWLNLSPNHLDRYHDVAEYRAAKLRIFENQTFEDFAVVNACSDLPGLAARRLTFSAMKPDATFALKGSTITHSGRAVLDQNATRLRGVHNAENLMAALAIGLALGVDLPKLADAVRDYSPPPHRCEFVRERHGVLWINDSKATNLDAVEKAILSQDKPIVLIAGGKDKGFEFGPLLPLVRQRVRTAVLIGEMSARIASEWQGVNCLLSGTLEEAVALADAKASPGDIVLFSPGTSSFDMFRSYIERGECFKAAVAKLAPATNHFITT